MGCRNIQHRRKERCRSAYERWRPFQVARVRRFLRGLVSARVILSKGSKAIYLRIQTCRNEYIYEGPLKSFLILTSELPSNPRDVEALFENISCVLCTLGTILSPTLEHKRIFTLVPPIHVIVDEASQIDVFDYLVSASSIILL
jgi:hypothetical protein